MADDIVFEPNADADNAVDVVEKVKKLKEELAACRKEREEYLAGWQRAKADFINARKDEEKVRASFVKFANEGLIADVLPVLESFERAMGNKNEWEKVGVNWRTGVEHIAALLKKTLTDNGLTEVIPTIGAPHDAARDEAVGHTPVEKESENNTIVEVVEKGYELNGKILKPPKVKVGELKIKS